MNIYSIHTGVLYWSQPINNQCVSGPAVVILVMISRHTSAITIRKHLKKVYLLLTGPGNYTTHLGPDNEATGREQVHAQGQVARMVNY